MRSGAAALGWRPNGSDAPAAPQRRASVSTATCVQLNCGEIDAAGSIMLDVRALPISQELARRGIADTRVHAIVDVVALKELPMAAITQTGKSFAWLGKEADLNSDADLIERTGVYLWQHLWAAPQN